MLVLIVASCQFITLFIDVIVYSWIYFCLVHLGLSELSTVLEAIHFEIVLKVTTNRFVFFQFSFFIPLHSPLNMLILINESNAMETPKTQITEDRTELPFLKFQFLLNTCLHALLDHSSKLNPTHQPAMRQCPSFINTTIKQIQFCNNNASYALRGPRNTNTHRKFLSFA